MIYVAEAFIDYSQSSKEASFPVQEYKLYWRAITSYLIDSYFLMALANNPPCSSSFDMSNLGKDITLKYFKTTIQFSNLMKTENFWYSSSVQKTPVTRAKTGKWNFIQRCARIEKLKAKHVHKTN